MAFGGGALELVADRGEITIGELRRYTAPASTITSRQNKRSCFGAIRTSSGVLLSDSLAARRMGHIEGMFVCVLPVKAERRIH